MFAHVAGVYVDQRGSGAIRGTTYTAEQDPFHRLAFFQGPGLARDLAFEAFGFCRDVRGERGVARERHTSRVEVLSLDHIADRVRRTDPTVRSATSPTDAPIDSPALLAIWNDDAHVPPERVLECLCE
jgi:hypothetical protein